jgi:hypothetical protein
MMDDKGSKAGRTRRTPEKAPAVAASRSTATAKPAVAAKPAAPKKAAAPRKVAATPVAAPVPAATPVAAPAAAAGRAAGPDRAELVRMTAYFRAERRGFAPGYEVEDWLAAEAEVAGQTAPAGASATGKAAARKPSAD